MPKHYCPSCGSGNDYTLSVPKFCGQCGKSFAQASLGAAPVTQQPSRPKLVPYRGDDDDDAEPVQISVPAKLDVEWEVEPRQRQTLGSIMQGSEDKAVFDKGGKRLGKKAVKQKVEEWRSKLQTTVRHEVGGARGGEE